MTLYPDLKIYGLTGEVGRDGILTTDQQVILDRVQHEAATTVLDRLSQRQEGGFFPIAAMATGIGKTRVEHEIIETWRRKNPQAKILFIAGTKLSLVEQQRSALTQYQKSNNGGVSEYTESENLEDDTQETADIEEALATEQADLPLYRVGRFKDRDVDVKVATIQTVQSAFKNGRLNFDEFDLVVVDEVHNIGTPPRVAIINQFKNVVGLTATPFRHSGKMKRPDQYGFEVVYNFPLPDAQNARLLPPLLGMQENTAGLVEEIPTKQNGTIDYKKLEQILKKSPDLRPFIADKVAQIIKDGEKEYKTVMAVNFVWEAQELAQLLKDKGIKVGVAVNQVAAKQIHTSEIPALGTIERYKLPREDPNAIQVLISPYVASEGFDAPFTEVLVWASPTDSDLRYTQYVGRLARRSEGKLFGLNLDFLYQTSQFGWSYNMAMWMKGEVRQLPSGLLYLGPEQDIAGLAELDVVKNMRGKGDIMDLSDIQRGVLENLKDTDISLTGSGLTSEFVGGSVKIVPIANEVRTKLESEHPEYFDKRRNVGVIVDVVTEEGRKAFIDAMVEAKIELRNKSIKDVKDIEIILTAHGLTSEFVGGSVKIVPIANEVRTKLESEHPEYFDRRMNGARSVGVVTEAGRQAFIDAMVEAGVKLKDKNIESLKDTDLPFNFNREGLTSVFVGDKAKLKQLANEVRTKLESEHPEYFDRRMNGARSVGVVTEAGRQAFIDAMVGEGVELQDENTESIKDTDLSLSEDGLSAIFRDEHKSAKIAKEVRAKLEPEHPEYFERRRNVNRIARVVTEAGRQAFIDAMVEAGVKLKNPQDNTSI